MFAGGLGCSLLWISLASLSHAEHMAPNALQQFINLKHHPVTLGFHPTGLPNLTLNDHWQSIIRAPPLGTPLFFLSKSDADNILWASG